MEIHTGDVGARADRRRGLQGVSRPGSLLAPTSTPAAVGGGAGRVGGVGVSGAGGAVVGGAGGGVVVSGWAGRQRISKNLKILKVQKIRINHKI